MNINNYNKIKVKMIEEKMKSKFGEYCTITKLESSKLWNAIDLNGLKWIIPTSNILNESYMIIIETEL